MTNWSLSICWAQKVSEGNIELVEVFGARDGEAPWSNVSILMRHDP